MEHGGGDVTVDISLRGFSHICFVYKVRWRDAGAGNLSNEPSKHKGRSLPEDTAPGRSITLHHPVTNNSRPPSSDL